MNFDVEHFFFSLCLKLLNFATGICFMEQLAENWHKGRYDQRNEWACRLAAEAIDHLAENDLYHLPEEYYENHKQ